MSVQLYNQRVQPRAPDRFFLCEEVRGVMGHYPGKKNYALDSLGWIEGMKRVVVLRGDVVAAECSAAELKPQRGDIIIVAKGQIERLRADPRGGITLTDDTYHREFPEDGVLLRKANGGHDVYLGRVVAGYCSEAAARILALA